MARRVEDVHPTVEHLTADGRVKRLQDGQIEAVDFVIPRGAVVGWEAAVFDHVQAVIQTICQRLQRATTHSNKAAAQNLGVESVGGSTYSFDLAPGHPLEAEVKGQLEALRLRLGELRGRVDEHNRRAGLLAEYEQVVTYVGQCILERERAHGGR